MVNITIDTASNVPPYEQLRAQIAALVASGELAAGTRLATVRQMASDLGLATNTVARSYRELEADGIIATHGRRGTFVRTTTTASAPLARQLAREYATTARRMGLTCPEATGLIEAAWSG